MHRPASEASLRWTRLRNRRFAKLAGLKNGALLASAESAGFEVLITTDQQIPYQQNLAKRRLSILILCAQTSRLDDLDHLLSAALIALDSIKPGEVIRIGTLR